MLRKQILGAAFALALLTPFAAEASESAVPYTPQAVKSALGQGCAVLLQFHANW